MTQPFRFIHASDFHLERPPRGMADVPDHLRPALVDAPHRAAERVFDAAVKQRVDFVVLAGDLLDPLTAGPRGLVFLADQFQKVAQTGIKVYWALGRSDNFERLGTMGPLADHAVTFPLARVQRIVHARNGEPLVQILGTSAQQRKRIRVADFRADGELFALAIAYGSADAQALAGYRVNYWALGGEHDRRALLSGGVTANYSGSPQGRRPQESGPHGCTLAQVDEQHFVRTAFIATDAVRYQEERVSVDESTTPGQLHQIIGGRIGELLGDPFGPDLLIHWTLCGSGALAAELRRGKLAADLTARLRAEYGQARPAAWTLALEAENPDEVPAELCDEETVLGEFLRTVRHYVEHPEEKLDLEPFLAERHLTGNLGAAVLVDEPALRKRVLDEVARLGVQLLSPQEPRP